MRRLIFITLFFATVLPLSAVDFGGVFDNTTKLAFPSVVPEESDKKVFLDQRDSLTAWLRVPINKDGSFYFATEGFFQFKYMNGDPKTYQTDSTYQFVLDLTLLKLGYTLKIDSKNSISASLGRFGITDMSGIVLNQNADGIMLNYDRRWINFNFYAGYTGLLNSLNVNMLRHQNSTYQRVNENWYDFATPYVIVDGAISFPYFLLHQTFSAQFLMAAGVGGLNAGYSYGNIGISRYFLTLALNGPIASQVFYVATSTFEFEEYGVANMSRLVLSYYPKFLSSSISLNGVYASGNNGNLKSFTGITSNTAVHSREKREYTGLVKTGLSASIKPFDVLHVSGGVDVVFDCPEDSISYDGIDWNATVKWQPFSDLYLSAGVTHFIGKQEYERTKDKLELALKLSLSF